MSASPNIGQLLELADERSIVTACVRATGEDGQISVELASPVILPVGTACATRMFDGSRVWHLEYVVTSVEGTTLELQEFERRCVGEERAAERATCSARAVVRLASPSEDSVGAWAEVIDLSIAGVRFRTESPIAGGSMVDLDIDDGSGNLISMRTVVLESSSGVCRGSIVAIGARAGQRLTQVIVQARAAGASVPPESDPLAHLRAALAERRERHRFAS